MAVIVSNAVFAWGNGTTAQASLSVSGADRALFIGLAPNSNPTVSSPVVDGSPLTLIEAETLLDAYSYYFIAPNTGTRTVSITLSAAVNWGLLVASLTGVHQSSPIGTPVSNQNTEQAGITTSATGVADGLVLDFSKLIIDVMNPGAGQTRYPTSGDQGNSYFGGFQSIGMSAKGGTGSVSMSWDSVGGTFGDNYHIVVPFLPSVGGGSSSSSNQNLLLMGVG